MCDDCQAYAHFLKMADAVLDEHGGTDIFQISLSQLKITQGHERIKCLRLTEKGLCRWYAGCCNTPIANSLPLHKVPFVGVVHTVMDHAADKTTREQALGPIRAKIYGKFCVGKLPQDAYQTAPLRILLRWLTSMLIGWVMGRYKPHPFFESNTGKPIVVPYVLMPAERENLRKLCGPKA